MKNIRILLALLCFTLMYACHDDENAGSLSSHTDVFKVAVIVPGDLLPYWQSSAEWAQEILNWAQQGRKGRVLVNLEFHDENAPDIDAYIQSVAEDESYAAMIGPVNAKKASLAARACRKLKKLLILPITTNAEFQRVYSTLDHVFNLTQSDIIQTEAMLASKNGAIVPGMNNSLGLIVSDDEYGQTFYDWFGFLATERSYDVPFICRFGDSISIADAIKKAYQLRDSNPFMTEFYFVPSDANDLIKAKNEIDRIDDYMEENYGYRWSINLFCSDVCVNEKVAKTFKNGFEGIEPTANPASGFIAAYEARFDEHPRRGEAQVFDAVYLVYYSLKAMLADGRQVVEDAIDDSGKSCRHSPLWKYFIEIVDADKTYSYNWFDYDAQQVFMLLENNFPVSVEGASSTFDFDQKYHCAVTTTTYRHWKLYEGEFMTKQYFSADGSGRTISTLNDWTFKVFNEQELEQYTTNITYPEHKDNYAVIVAASSGWSNYRHQADALAMYQALKTQGFDDDHIILIMEDDIAHHERNLYPGAVMITSKGKNLHEDVTADYRMSSLYPADIQNILTGVKTARTPTVLEATENDNVFFFWSGHGHPNSLIYNENDFTSSEIRKTLETMKSQKRFRKLFFVMETCFSGSVAKACEGIEGVLMLTAANEGETSKADMYDDELGVYLSNGFTRAFQTKITEDPEVTLRDLFYYVVRQTAGSHASLYNYKNYGNIYTERLNEMLYRNAEEN